MKIIFRIPAPPQYSFVEVHKEVGENTTPNVIRGMFEDYMEMFTPKPPPQSFKKASQTHEKSPHQRNDVPFT